MIAKLKTETFLFAPVVGMAAALALLCGFSAITTNAQTVSSSNPKIENQTTEKLQPTVLMPVWKNYKEITIGMTADEVKDKLGKAEIADKDGFYYKFSDNESAQIVLDPDRKVRVISVIYKVEEGNPPKIEDVLGTVTAVEPNANGSVYKLVRYPEAGFWVAYNRTAGDHAIVTVTIQKL